MLKRYSLAVLLLVSIASPAWAQASADGTIRGVVKDQQGAVLPGVTITATSPSVAGARTAAR